MLRSFRAQAFAVGGLLLLLLVSGSFVAQLLITERHQRALAEAVASGALIALPLMIPIPTHSIGALEEAELTRLDNWATELSQNLDLIGASLHLEHQVLWTWGVDSDAKGAPTVARTFRAGPAGELMLELTTSQAPRGDAMREAARDITLRWLIAVPSAGLLLFLLFRGPAYSLREIRRFLDRLPSEVGRTLDTSGHIRDFAEVIAAMNRASALLAEQRQQLENLSGAARNFTSIVQNTGIGLLLTNRKGEIEWANAGFTRLTGYSHEEVRGRRPVELLEAVGPEPHSLSDVSKSTAAGKPVSIDLLCRRADGTRRWLRFDAEPVRDPDGALSGYMTLHTDATPRLQALKAVRGGQAVLSAVAKIAERMLRSRDWRSHIDTSLRELARAAGAQRALLLRLDADRGVATASVNVGSTGYVEALYPFQEAPLGPWIDALSRGENVLLSGPPGSEAELSGRAETPGTLALCPVLVDDRLWGALAMDGGIGAEAWSPEQLLAFGAAADILSAAILSAQRSEALSDERAFATQVLDGVFDGVAVLDDTGRVVFANNALQAMLGEDGSELIGRNLHELGLPAAKPSATEGATSEPGVINRFETTLAKGAVPRTLMVREATTPIGGRDERRIVLVSDVTQRKRLEEELLRAAANAEAASEAKSRLLGRVSHELRTPLNAVLGFAQLAALDATTPELRDSVIEIQRAGAHLDRLINDLIDVSRSDTGELNIEFEHVDLEAIARESIALMNPVAAGSGITLHIEVGDQVRVIADPGRLMQILLNLLSNAVKYNRQGGAVKVRVGSTADRTYGRIEIEDSGPGISAEEQHRLFTPFERLSNAGDRAGTGIGLALSRILAERMGGEIGVESREGVGSRFWVDFALAPEREQGAWR